MNQLLLSLLAFTGGILLAIQGGINARLGVLLQHPLLASLVAFCVSATFALVFVLTGVKNIPSKSELMAIPHYMWFTGGLFSVVGISLYYFTIPKLGVSTMISLGLCGQLIFGVIAGHFGWFHLPTEPISLQKILGVGAMILGILLINLK